MVGPIPPTADNSRSAKSVLDGVQRLAHQQIMLAKLIGVMVHASRHRRQHVTRLSGRGHRSDGLFSEAKRWRRCIRTGLKRSSKPEQCSDCPQPPSRIFAMSLTHFIPIPARDGTNDRYVRTGGEFSMNCTRSAMTLLWNSSGAY